MSVGQNENGFRSKGTEIRQSNFTGSIDDYMVHTAHMSNIDRMSQPSITDYWRERQDVFRRHFELFRERVSYMMSTLTVFKDKRDETFKEKS